MLAANSVLEPDLGQIAEIIYEPGMYLKISVLGWKKIYGPFFLTPGYISPPALPNLILPCPTLSYKPPFAVNYYTLTPCKKTHQPHIDRWPEEKNI